MVAAPAYVGKFSGRRDAQEVAGREDPGQEVGQDGVGLAGPRGLRRAHPAGHPELRAAVRHSGHDRRGKGLGGKALAFSGIRSIPIDPVKNAIDLAYARQRDIRKRLARFRQQGVNKDNPTPEWRKLNDQLKITTQIAYQGKAKAQVRGAADAGRPAEARP
jgi:hypothetical protein